MILTPEELRILTHRMRAKAQVRELNAMGIPYRQRTDGSPVVLVDDVVASKRQAPRTPKLRLG